MNLKIAGTRSGFSLKPDAFDESIELNELFNALGSAVNASGHTKAINVPLQIIKRDGPYGVELEFDIDESKISTAENLKPSRRRKVGPRSSAKK